MNRVSLYFVASPLHYLCASSIAKGFENSSRNILVYYKKSGLEKIIDKNEWESVVYMPHPRKEPLEGVLGKTKRISQNLELVCSKVGFANEICVHSSEYDTEAINYFISYIQKKFGKERASFRILPDGILNLSIHPQPIYKKAATLLKIFRRFFDKKLRFTVFKGDRIGSQAPFVDRIYILNGFSHKYDKEKSVELPPLCLFVDGDTAARTKKALIIGQYLLDKGELSKESLDEISDSLKSWLDGQDIQEIHYRGHPRDAQRELFREGYLEPHIEEVLESYMSKNRYDIVVSVFSTALVTARQIYPKSTRVVSFGLKKVNFKDTKRRDDILALFEKLGVEII